MQTTVLAREVVFQMQLLSAIARRWQWKQGVLEDPNICEIEISSEDLQPHFFKKNGNCVGPQLLSGKWC